MSCRVIPEEKEKTDEDVNLERTRDSRGFGDKVTAAQGVERVVL